MLLSCLSATFTFPPEVFLNVDPLSLCVSLSIRVGSLAVNYVSNGSHKDTSANTGVCVCVTWTEWQLCVTCALTRCGNEYQTGL